MVNEATEIPKDNEVDGTKMADDVYSESLRGLPSQQAMLVGSNESLALNSRVLNELHDNDNKILLLLKGNANANSSYTFNGLVRELNMHQQSISRSIKRLVDLGLIEQIKNYGFRLTKLGQHLGMTTTSTTSNNNHRKYNQLAYLEMNITKFDIDRITLRLVGKWFENLRWVGKIGDSGPSILRWKSYDNTFGINVTVMQNSLLIESDALLQKEIIEAAKTIPKIIAMVTNAVLEPFSPQVPSNNYMSLSRMYSCGNGTRYN
ncbi:MAG TPA: MarR family transcriptional regulator [Nitrososphaeraceae archaeon]|nr:MarR family transcriptional regulator [Nitrososphaeraceae archaeon]